MSHHCPRQTDRRTEIERELFIGQSVAEAGRSPILASELRSLQRGTVTLTHRLPQASSHRLDLRTERQLKEMNEIDRQAESGKERERDLITVERKRFLSGLVAYDCTDVSG